MASVDARLPENTPGDFFVDRSCIDCGTCREVAPAVFAAGREASFVHQQPTDEDMAHRARLATIACPVGAIGSITRQSMRLARASFPEHIDGGVYYCGYACRESHGARSYLIVRAGGNILVDSPRYAQTLLKRIKALGGVRWMFLTHRDDVAEHRKFRDLFGCERILHRDDVTAGTADVERIIEGDAPVALNDQALMVPLPGHTAGSMALLYRERFLFSGDHAWWDPGRGDMVASRDVCWHDWNMQMASQARLASLRFEWLLPGHGSRGHADVEAMQAAARRCEARMRDGNGSA